MMRTQKIPGWGLVSEYRRGKDGYDARVVFPNEEAPHWMPYRDLADHRRRLLLEQATHR